MDHALLPTSFADAKAVHHEHPEIPLALGHFATLQILCRMNAFAAGSQKNRTPSVLFQRMSLMCTFSCVGGTGPGEGSHVTFHPSPSAWPRGSNLLSHTREKSKHSICELQ